MTTRPGSLRFDLLVIASAIGFGAMPFFAVQAYDAGLTLQTVLTLRFVIAGLVIFGYLALTRRLTRPSRRLLVVGTGLGLAYAGMATCYFSAVASIPPTLATLLLYTYPAFVAVTAGLLGRAVPSVGVLAALGLSLAGIALAVAPGQLELGPGAGVGIAFGLAAPVIYTGYIIASGRFSGGLPSWELTGIVCLVGAVVVGGQGAVTGALQIQPPSAGWIPVLLVALVSTVVAIGCFLAAVPVIGPTRASIISTVEPVANLIIGVTLFGAALSWGQGLGTILVLSGAALAILNGRMTTESQERAEPIRSS